MKATQLYRKHNGKRHLTYEDKASMNKSMNRDEGPYQLPHIYDYLLSTTATPGGQSLGTVFYGPLCINLHFTYLYIPGALK